MTTTWKIFTAAEAKAWGWIPKDGDQSYSADLSDWTEIKDGTFEVEPLNRRPVEMLETDQLVRNQQAFLEIARVKLDIEAIKNHLYEFHGVAI